MAELLAVPGAAGAAGRHVLFGFSQTSSLRQTALLSLGLRKARYPRRQPPPRDPRLLHQTWKRASPLPDKYRTCQKSWKRLNPDHSLP